LKKKPLSDPLPSSPNSLLMGVLPVIEVNINNGKVHIDGKNVNYSFGSLHHVFRKAIRYKSKRMADAKNTLILGFGAGSIAKILWDEKAYSTQITGVDFEPMMFELAEQHAGIRDFENLDLIVTDAEKYMKECKDGFDVVFIDLFIEDQIPSFCLTSDFILQVKHCLTPRGLVVWNTLASTEIAKQIQAIAHELSFNTIESQQVTKENCLVFIT